MGRDENGRVNILHTHYIHARCYIHIIYIYYLVSYETTVGLIVVERVTRDDE